MVKNKLTINLKKTQCMIIGTEQRLRNCRKLLMKVDDITIENISCAKLLGVYIDRCLTWSEHVEILSKKLASKIGDLCRLRSFLSTDLLLKSFNTIVFPHFNYCCTVWGNMKNKDCLHKLCKVQNRAARVILNRNFYTPTTEMMQQLRWMPLSDYFKYRTIILVFKVLHGLTPD